MRTGKKLVLKLLCKNTGVIVAASPFDKSCPTLQDSQLLQNRNVILKKVDKCH